MKFYNAQRFVDSDLAALMAGQCVWQLFWCIWGFCMRWPVETWAQVFRCRARPQGAKPLGMPLLREAMRSRWMSRVIQGSCNDSGYTLRGTEVILAKMSQRNTSHGPYGRADGETFTIESTLYETPMGYNYWMGIFAARHREWGQMGFQAIIPKGIAMSVEHAEALLKGSILDQVKSELTKVTAEGRDFAWCQSNDGWHLVG